MKFLEKIGGWLLNTRIFVAFILGIIFGAICFGLYIS